MNPGRFQETLLEVSSFVDAQSRFWSTAGLPATLFHYTTAEGLIGIISSKSLWMSDMLSLNDASEAAYPYKVMAEVLDTQQPGISEEHRRRFKIQLTDYTFRLYAPFVVCFSEHGDLLSQWRAYGSGGEGFSLAFESSWLSSLKDFRLQRVIYDRSQQEDLVLKLLQRVSSILSGQPFSEEEQTQIWLGAAASLAPWVIMFKDPAFSEEREWRLVNVSSMAPGHFRRSGHRIVPYLTLPLDNSEAITGVVRGPYFTGTDPRGVYVLMVSQGFVLGGSIRDSQIPLRR